MVLVKLVSYLFDLGIKIMVLKSGSGRRNECGGNDAVSGCNGCRGNWA